MKTVINPQGEISMSDAISQIIEPYRQDAPDYQSFHKLVALACAAWNASILPTEEREKMLQEMLAIFPSKRQSQDDFLYVINDLINRKKKLFPHVSRMIVQYKVTDRGNDYHICHRIHVGKEGIGPITFTRPISPNRSKLCASRI